MAYMDFMDLARKAVKFNHSLTHFIKPGIVEKTKCFQLYSLFKVIGSA